MKISWMRCALAAVTLTAGLGVGQAWAGDCSTGREAGTWAYTYTGTIFTASGALPGASVGHFRQGWSGKLSGSQSRSVAGTSGDEDISGSITVNADCSASATINVLVGGELQRTALLDLVYDQGGNHVRGIFKSLALADGTNVPVTITIEGSRVISK